MKNQCIYCRELNLKYSDEHVIPRSFGTFGCDTLTLNDSVCSDCNQLFGDTIENKLARKTIIGTKYRYEYGLIPVKKYNKYFFPYMGQ